MFFGTGQTVNLAVDSTGIPTEVATSTQERWVGVFLRFKRLLSDPRTEVVHDLKATMRVAHWAYTQAEAAQSSVWLLAGDFEALPPSWRDMLKCA